MESSHNVTRDRRTEEGSSPSWVSAGVNLRR
uniref:Uncharacterized protein n=1 Tax=Arundo donax TaxID=35708 RepID=A0A0A8Y0P6_ARUDO